MRKETKEKTILLLSVLFEVYRVFTGCLMVVFLPNQCGNHKCNPFENWLIGDIVYRIGYYANLQTFAVMAILYLMETRRENRLRKYLLFNTHNPMDSESVGVALGTLPEVRQQWLHTLHARYRSIVYVAYAAYALNTILSAYLVGDGFFDVTSEVDERTVIAFFTSVLFLGAKLYDTYTIVFVDPNIFYSAYTKTHLQFNDVQAKKKHQHLINDLA